MSSNDESSIPVPAPPEGHDATYVEPAGGGTFVEGSLSSAAGAGSPKTVELGGRSYSVVRRIPVGSAEADLFVVEDPGRSRFVLKYYRQGIKPKVEVLEKISAISSEDVIRIAGFGTSASGRFYELQEFAGFGTLENLIAEGRARDERFVADFMAELNSCLRSIHSHGIIHRDIKPANILVRSLEPLDLVLTDFGISSAAELSIHQTGLSRTIIFSAPETLTGVISKAVDYWSFGIILLSIVSGAHPYAKMSEAEVLFSLSSRPVPGAANAGGRFSKPIRGLLTRDASRRWGCDEVGAWLGGDGSVPEYFEDVPEAGAAAGGAAAPFEFAGGSYSDLAAIAAAMACSREAAAGLFGSKAFSGWVAESLGDRKTAFLIDELAADRSLSPDEKVFEFVYRVNPDLELRFAGRPVTSEFLASAGWRAANGERDEDTRFFDSVVRGGALKKYFGLTSSVPPGLAGLARGINDVASVSSAVEAAVMTLALLGDDTRSRLSRAVAEKFHDAVVIKPARGFADEEETAASALKFASGGELHHAKIVQLFLIGPAALISRKNVEAMKDELAAKCRRAFEEYPLFAENLAEALSGGPGRQFLKSVLESRPEFSRDYYLKLHEFSKIFERKYSEVAGRRPAARADSRPPAPGGGAEKTPPARQSAFTARRAASADDEPVPKEFEYKEPPGVSEFFYYAGMLGVVLVAAFLMKYLGENFRTLMASLGVMGAVGFWMFYRTRRR